MRLLEAGSRAKSWAGTIIFVSYNVFVLGEVEANSGIIQYVPLTILQTFSCDQNRIYRVLASECFLYS